METKSSCNAWQHVEKILSLAWSSKGCNLKHPFDIREFFDMERPEEATESATSTMAKFHLHDMAQIMATKRGH